MICFYVHCSENPGCAAHVCRSVADAIKLVSSPPLADQIENVWIWGGGGVYKVSLLVDPKAITYKPKFYRPQKAVVVC